MNFSTSGRRSFIVFGDVNRAPNCQGVSSPTQPRILPAPSATSCRDTVDGAMTASTCPPLKAATIFGTSCSGTIVTSLTVKPCFCASSPIM